MLSTKQNLSVETCYLFPEHHYEHNALTASGLGTGLSRKPLCLNRSVNQSSFLQQWQVNVPKYVKVYLTNISLLSLHQEVLCVLYLP